AVGYWREAIEGYAALGEAELEAQVCGELAWHMLWGARWPDALELIERSLAVVGPQPTTTRAGVLIHHCLAHSVAGHFEEAEEIRRAAVELAEALGDHRLQARALFAAATLDWMLSRFADAVEAGRRVAAMFK